MRKLLIAVGGLVALFYIAACTYMYVQQRKIVFEPSTNDVAAVVGEVPGASNVMLEAADGVALKAWWVEPRAGYPIYLYLHGNAGNLVGSFTNPQGRAERFVGLTQAGAGLLALSWRGYGGSAGEPSEAGFKQDAEAALAWIQQRYPDRPIIMFGESLGTSIAMQLAAAHEFGALVLDSPYTSIVDVGQGKYPWLPVRMLSKDHFESLRFASQVTERVLIQHCTQDRVVPYAMGQQLFEALASTDKHFESVEGECHVPSILQHLRLFRELESGLLDNAGA
jgi:fermentation-respiration switch protein FrsA (DUF1100 family)